MRAAVTILRGIGIFALAAPIHVYRYILAPLIPGVCRFTPGCSNYALEALHQHGPVKGSALAARRLLRCHPITWLGGASGFDPVPPAGNL